MISRRPRTRSDKPRSIAQAELQNTFDSESLLVCNVRIENYSVIRRMTGYCHVAAENENKQTAHCQINTSTSHLTGELLITQLSRLTQATIYTT